MGQFSVGQSVRRVEDHRFLTGHGRYIDDIDLPHRLYAYVLRSPHAHFRLPNAARLGEARAGAR